MTAVTCAHVAPEHPDFTQEDTLSHVTHRRGHLPPPEERTPCPHLEEKTSYPKGPRTPDAVKSRKDQAPRPEGHPAMGHPGHLGIKDMS